MEDRFRALLDKVGGAITGRPPRHLTLDEADWVFGALLEGTVSASRTTAMLLALRAKGPTAEELAGCARAARARVKFPELPAGTVVLSTSRRGKHSSPPFGLAAAAAAAACGARVLVQASSGVPGGGITLGDVWIAAGGRLNGDPDAAEEALNGHGMACWHPTLADRGWQPLLDTESDLGLRLLPDVIGKLLLPQACRVVVAAMPGPVLGRAGEALQLLGHPQAIIVQGVEGSLDAALSRPTRGLRLQNGTHFPLRLRPEDFGAEQPGEPPMAALADRAQAALTGVRTALLGGSSPYAAVAALGAAMILSLVEEQSSLAESAARAQEALESGAAQARWEGALAMSRSGPEPKH
jgi:anthranilate phosphoribosyltransferase